MHRYRSLSPIPMNTPLIELLFSPYTSPLTSFKVYFTNSEYEICSDVDDACTGWLTPLDVRVTSQNHQQIANLHLKNWDNFFALILISFLFCIFFLLLWATFHLRYHLYQLFRLQLHNSLKISGGLRILKAWENNSLKLPNCPSSRWELFF